MTGYMQSMHALVVLQCEASVILLNGAGELLLQRRADNGFWGYHGGSVGLDEAVEEAVARELFEETGLTAHRLTLFGVFSGPALHHVYPNGDKVSNMDIVYLCRDWSGELRRQADEVLELRFFPPAGMPAIEKISPPNRPALVAYLARLDRLSAGEQAIQNRGD